MRQFKLTTSDRLQQITNCRDNLLINVSRKFTIGKMWFIATGLNQAIKPSRYLRLQYLIEMRRCTSKGEPPTLSICTNLVENNQTKVEQVIRGFSYIKSANWLTLKRLHSHPILHLWFDFRPVITHGQGKKLRANQWILRCFDTIWVGGSNPHISFYVLRNYWKITSKHEFLTLLRPARFYTTWNSFPKCF